MSLDALDQTKGPAQFQIWWDQNVSRFQSPISGKQQRAHQFGLWNLVLTYQDLDPLEAMPLLAFFNAHALTTRFTVYDQARPLPRGLARTSGAVWNGAGSGGDTGDGNPQRGYSLYTSNWTAGSSGIIFYAGDLIGIASTGEVYEVAANVACPTPTGMEGVSIPLAQPIRTSPQAHEVIVCEQVPFTVMASKAVKATVTTPAMYSFDVELTEDFG